MGKLKPARRSWVKQAGVWLLAVGVSLAALAGLAVRVGENERATVRLAGQELRVELADSPEQWAVGLMNRSALGAHEGMLFVFPNEAARSFWMKNVSFPLDLIYFDSQQRVVGVQTLQPCTSLVCPSYPGPKAQYVLEVRAGSAARWGVKIGDRLQLVSARD